MRRHRLVGHGAPWMIGGRRLRVPDVAGVTGQLSATQCIDHRIANRDLGTRGVHDVRTAPHGIDQVCVEQVICLWLQRGMDVDDVHRADQGVHVWVIGEPQLLLHMGRQSTSVEVVQPHVKWLEPTHYCLSDAPCRDDADIESLKVVGAFNAVGDVPAAVDHPLVRRKVIAHQCQDLHDGMLSHTDAVAVRHLGDGDTRLDRSIQVNMVRADSRRQCQLQLGRLGNSLRTEICGPEGLRDDHIGVGQLLLKHRVGPIFVGGNH